MKIVVFGNGRGFGGAQQAFRGLIDFLVADGHSVGVIGLVGSNDVLPGNKSLNFASRLNEESWRMVKVAQTLCAARRCRRFKPELFVAVGLAKSAELIARCLPRKTFRIAQDFIFGRSPNDPLLKRLPSAFDALATLP